MSDDAEAYHNAWASSFSRPDRKLLCSYHVDRSWRRKIKEHIKDKELQTEVYAAFKSLQNETNEAGFRGSLQHVLAWLREKSDAFASYFEKTYARRPREWASCFRVGTRINTNMFAESFHRTLKEVYFERKQTRRVDHLLFKLLKISRDKAYEQLIKAEKGKATVRQRENIKRHKQAELLPANALSKKDTDCWEVPSSKLKGKVYLVRKISPLLCTCPLQCLSCKACVHLFDCTCLDYVIRGVVCTHIHAVSMAQPQNDSKVLEIDDTFVEEHRENLANLTPLSKEQKDCSQLEDLRTNALSVIAEITNAIQEAPNSDTIHTALRHVRSAISVAKGLTIIGNDHQYLKTKSYPANKLAERQKRFFSTKSKKKLKEKRSVLSETTIEEVKNTVPLVCAFCFKEDPPNCHGDVIDWVECGSCQVLVHTLCDHVEDNADYVCCMSRASDCLL